MIKCNLAVLMAQREIKISELAERTKISRTTLTALYYNHGKGVQFDTMETLCEFFRITPGELFSKIDFKMELLQTDTIDKDTYNAEFRVIIESKIFDESFIVSFQNISPDKKKITISIPTPVFDSLTPIPSFHVTSELYREFMNKFEAYSENEVFDMEIERINNDNKQ